jgi:hypothetical protein
MPNILKRIILTLLLFPSVLYLPGCDLPGYPEKVEGLPNTFRREPLRRKEKVLSVWVRDFEGTAWLIMAVKPISLKDFNVQVGVVPEGFEQMIPPDNQEFSPVVGNSYSIAIMTDVRNHDCAYVLQVGISWTVEE